MLYSVNGNFCFLSQDSVADMSDREPGEVRLRDPMAVLLSRIQNYRRSADNSASEGELLTEELRMPDGGQRRSEAREPGEVGVCYSQGVGGGYSGFLVTGLIEWGQRSKLQKIPDQKLTPKKSHAEFPSLKNFQKGLHDITRTTRSALPR